MLLSDETKRVKEAAVEKDMVGFNTAEFMLEGVEKAVEEVAKMLEGAVQKTAKKQEFVNNLFFQQKPKQRYYKPYILVRLVYALML